jgi:hypothetical protein
LFGGSEGKLKNEEMNTPKRKKEFSDPNKEKFLVAVGKAMKESGVSNCVLVYSLNSCVNNTCVALQESGDMNLFYENLSDNLSSYLTHVIEPAS